MSQIIAVASGKGGAGKSSVCTFLGRELALLGRRTLIVELDSGLRGRGDLPERTAGGDRTV